MPNFLPLGCPGVLSWSEPVKTQVYLLLCIHYLLGESVIGCVTTHPGLISRKTQQEQLLNLQRCIVVAALAVGS